MWVILAFLSACLLGFYDVFKKKSLASNAVLPVLMINTLVCAAFFVPFIVASSVGWCAALHWALRWAVPECGCCKDVPTRWNVHFFPQRKKIETFFRFSLTECDGYGIISLAACADTELPP